MLAGIAIFQGVLFSSGAIPVFGNVGTGVGVEVTLVVDVGAGIEVEVTLRVDVDVDVGVGVGVGVTAGVEVALGVVGVDGAAHVALVTVFVSNVTAPFRANTLPSTFAPVVSVADVKARIFPLKVEFAPSVAELPTCQKTLHAWAPFTRLTLLAPAVISVEAVLKMKTALELPWASSVRVPVIPNVPAAES